MDKIAVAEVRKMIAVNLMLDMGRAESELERIILMTPTGPERNSLTDANIHIKEAIAILKKANF